MINSLYIQLVPKKYSGKIYIMIKNQKTSINLSNSKDGNYYLYKILFDNDKFLINLVPKILDKNKFITYSSVL